MVAILVTVTLLLMVLGAEQARGQENCYCSDADAAACEAGQTCFVNSNGQSYCDVAGGGFFFSCYTDDDCNDASNPKCDNCGTSFSCGCIPQDSYDSKDCATNCGYPPIDGCADSSETSGDDKSTITYSCKAGYSSSGSPSYNATCVDRSWEIEDGASPCSDVDECTNEEDNCGDQTCINVPGSYICLPAAEPEASNCGYPAIDAAADSSETSGDNSSTITYSCKAGYSSSGSSSYMATCVDRSWEIEDGASQCSDVDECTNEENDCGDRTCINVPGSYICVREAETETTSCGHPPVDGYADASETSGEDGSTVLYTCKPGFGSSYTLTCTGGSWTLQSGVSPCTDEDECQLDGICGDGFEDRCHNTPGSFTCLCDYDPESATCTRSCGIPPVDGCAHHEVGGDGETVTYTCKAGFNKNCPSYTRTCSDGDWVLDGCPGMCEDLDECEDRLAFCDGPNYCWNTPGSYICQEMVPTLNPCEIMTSLGQCINGECELVDNQAECVCEKGYEGASCDVQVDRTSTVLGVISVTLSSIVLIGSVMFWIFNFARAPTVFNPPNLPQPGPNRGLYRFPRGGPFSGPPVRF